MKKFKDWIQKRLKEAARPSFAASVDDFLTSPMTFNARKEDMPDYHPWHHKTVYPTLEKRPYAVKGKPFNSGIVVDIDKKKPGNLLVNLPDLGRYSYASIPEADLTINRDGSSDKNSQEVSPIRV